MNTIKIIIKAASPGIEAEFVEVGLLYNQKSVVVTVQNDDGEVVNALLNRDQALQLAGSLQGFALCAIP